VAQQPPVGQGLLIIEASRSHSDTPHSVGILWTGDQPDAETWQQITLSRDTHPCPGRIRTRNPSKPAAADPRLRPRGHWDRLVWVTARIYNVLPSTYKSEFHPVRNLSVLVTGRYRLVRNDAVSVPTIVYRFHLMPQAKFHFISNTSACIYHVRRIWRHCLI
jgi:hypothetical protein